mmetsp:Transcript_51020/g.100289  ORF Transcript_51020/g.100289 Transcript_51020/m.100289 type:complete len:111 (-) Transcript_51020:209-541(-)
MVLFNQSSLLVSCRFYTGLLSLLGILHARERSRGLLFDLRNTRGYCQPGDLCMHGDIHEMEKRGGACEGRDTLNVGGTIECISVAELLSALILQTLPVFTSFFGSEWLEG